MQKHHLLLHSSFSLSPFKLFLCNLLHETVTERDQYYASQQQKPFQANPGQRASIKPHMSKIIIEYINDQVTLGLMVPAVNNENEAELDVPEKSLVQLQAELTERVKRHYTRSYRTSESEPGAEQINQDDFDLLRTEDEKKID